MNSISDPLTSRLLALAASRLNQLPGAFEQFRLESESGWTGLALEVAMLHGIKPLARAHDHDADFIQMIDAFAKGFTPIEVSAAPGPDAEPTATVGELDLSRLATPAELLEAFGQWGMKPVWFKDLNSRQWLLDARRRKGQGQRGQVVEPLFCPFAVMNGLIGKVHKIGRMKPDTAWRMLEHKFPKVYAAFENCDPRDRTGD